MRRTILLVTILLAGSLLTSSLHAQSGADVIRGRVTDSTGKAIAGATILVTDSLGLRRETKTGNDGRYTAVFRNGSGVYTIQIIAMGQQPTQRVIRRIADEAVLLADVIMHPIVTTTLTPVEVTAKNRPKASRDNGYAQGAGAAERVLMGANQRGAPPDQQGNLNTLAGSMPGVQLTPDGYSVLGMGADQNSTTLNGLQLNTANIPSLASVSGRVSTSTFDPSRGGFSGGQVALQINSGSNYSTRRVQFALDAPALQFSDAASNQLGQKYTNVRAGWAGTGALIIDKLFYNTSWQVARRSSNLQALRLDQPGALQRIGVAPDSVARLFSVLQSVGIPTTIPSPPSAAATTSYSTLSRIDLAPKNSNQQLGLTLSANLNNTGAGMLYPSAILTQGGKSTSGSITFQLEHSTYFQSAFLNDFETALSFNSNRSTPYLTLPDGSVLVTSALPDGSAGLATLAFGGNASLPSDGHDWSWEAHNETSWYSLDSKHSLEFTADTRVEGTSQDQFSNRYGTYTYNSLADIEGSTPTSFTRTFGDQRNAARDWQVAFSLGDSWRKSDRLQFQYGLRLEGTRFLSAPMYNPLVDSLFNVRTDHVPNTIQLSPRLGFTWIYGLPDESDRMAYFYSNHTPGVIRGGIGEFRSVLSPSTLVGVMSSTGLPDARRQLICLGADIPTPDWVAFQQDPSSVPSQCLNGDTPSPFATSSPSVELFSPDYAPTRSWRANLEWERAVKGVMFSIQGIYSLGLSETSTIDLNFADIQHFTLSDESNRPVFVSPASIVPTTGAVSTNESRRSADFLRVSSLQSDLHSRAKQATISLSPTTYHPFSWSLNYTLSQQRSQSRGFSGSTMGDPLTVTWDRGNSAVQHQIFTHVQMYAHGVFLAMYGQIASGRPYTPMVGGDINGDGYANDQAFIFDPKHTSDTTLANGMTSLINSLHGSARQCIMNQLGQIAARNSCVGPWTASMNASVSLHGGLLHLTDRLWISAYVENLLGGLDQLLHGANHLQGWGSTILPSAILLTPNGFDPTTNQFHYDVNPRFGDTRPSQNTYRSPVQISLSANIELTTPYEQQSLAAILRHNKQMQTDSAAREKFIQSTYTSNSDYPFRILLTLKDSLLLSQDQIKAIDTLRSQYVQSVDSLWAPVSAHLAGLGDKVNLKEEAKQIKAAETARLDLFKRYTNRIRSVLAPYQWNKIPSGIQQVLANGFSIAVYE